MSVKKLLVLSAAGLAGICASSAMAGGPDTMAAPMAPEYTQSVYLEGAFGYVQTDWANDSNNGVMGATASSLFNPNSHGKGYLTAAADLGYNFTKNIALEGGYIYLPSTSGGSTSATKNGIQAGGGMTIRSWAAYLAAKLSVAVVENIDLFGKIGVAYRKLNYSLNGSSVGNFTALTSNGHYWTPIFMTCAEYTWGNWLLGAQYTYLPANNQVNSKNNSFGAPN